QYGWIWDEQGDDWVWDSQYGWIWDEQDDDDDDNYWYNNNCNGNGNGNNNENNLGAAVNIEVSQICFPDTVTIGDTVVLCGYIVNKGNADFNNSLYVKYNIEDEMADNFSTDQEAGMEGSTDVSIPANDSLAFDIPVQVTENNFRVNSYDVVVVWPIGPSLSANLPKHTETFVKRSSTAAKNADKKTFLANTNYELYPNPVSSYFSIKASNNDAAAAIQKIEIFNTIGQSIFEQQYKNSTSKVNVLLPNHTLTGMYYLHLTDVNNQTFIEQLIVQ
ncbi:MAG: T9SS type A sorting domain-containing protein, partial [Chitinophagales bacterium]